jgi:hypothetical protein
MVRRRSPVRLRQRASAERNPRKSGIFVAWHSTTEHLRMTVWTDAEPSRDRQSACKIDLLRDSTEHLPGLEGVASRAAADGRSEPLEQTQFSAELAAVKGQRFHGGRSWGTPSGGAEHNKLRRCREGRRGPASGSSRQPRSRWRLAAAPGACRSPRMHQRIPSRFLPSVRCPSSCRASGLRPTVERGR